MPNSIVKNSVYNIVYKTINVVFPLVSAAYVSRILMADGIGKVASSQNIVQYFFLVAGLGLPTYGIKAIANARNDDELNTTFSSLFIINLFSTIICSILYYSLLNILPVFRDRVTLFAISGLKIPFNIFNIDWFFQGKEDYRYIMRKNIFVKICLFIAIFIFVKEENDYILYALIVVLATGLNYLFNLAYSRKYVKFTINNIQLKKHLKPVFALLAAAISIEVYTLADTTMLSFLKGDVIVGYYSQSVKAINVIKTLVTAVCAAFLPRLSYYIAVGNNGKFNELTTIGIKVLVFLSLPAVIGIMVLAPDMTWILFGPGFSDSILSTQILSVSIISCALSNFIGYQILVACGKEKQMLFSTIFGALSNIVLNIFLISRWGHYGAAIASVVTEIIVTICQFIMIRRIVCITLEPRYCGSVLLSNIAMLGVVIITSRCIKNSTISIIVCIIVGSLSYFFVSYIMGNEITISIRRKLYNILVNPRRR